jgi:hypothetical protein
MTSNRHLDTPITWATALGVWFVSGGVLIVTVILSAIGLVLNVFSVGNSARQSISWSAFDSPAPSSFIIFIILTASWLAFTLGWCFMAGAVFKKTFKHAYIWNVYVNIVLILAGLRRSPAQYRHAQPASPALLQPGPAPGIRLR